MHGVGTTTRRRRKQWPINYALDGELDVVRTQFAGTETRAFTEKSDAFRVLADEYRDILFARLFASCIRARVIRARISVFSN